MRQRHVVACLYAFVALWIATVAVAVVLTLYANRVRQKPKFIDPVIWREVILDDEEEQLQPDI